MWILAGSVTPLAHASWLRCLFAEVHVQICPFDVQFGPQDRSDWASSVLGDFGPWSFRSLKKVRNDQGLKWPRTELTIPQKNDNASVTSEVLDILLNLLASGCIEIVCNHWGTMHYVMKPVVGMLKWPMSKYLVLMDTTQPSVDEQLVHMHAWMCPRDP